MKQFLLRYFKNPRQYFTDKRAGVILSRTANGRACTFEGKNKIYPRVFLYGSFLGRGSYVGPDSRLPKCKIGRYCSIGPEVKILAGKHPVDERLSTHPAFYSTMKQGGFTYVEQQNFDEFDFCDEEKRFYVSIGSDAWIGARVTILGGVRIGNGVIIAAGSLVTKDVEDYSVVGGVPAKHIRFRFDEERRRSLLEDPWWDKDEEWIRANLDQFTEKQ